MDQGCEGIEEFSVSNDSHTYIPECDSCIKPKVAQIFSKLDDGIEFYKKYAAVCGFDTRQGTVTKHKDGTVLSRYVLCNREGLKNVDRLDEQDRKRRRLCSRTNCKARIIFILNGSDGYRVKSFVEAHNHDLTSTKYRRFMKFNRNLDIGHKNFILNCSMVNIGPVRSFRLFRELVGNYEDVGCNISDFKNFNRDLRAFVVGVDAQIILDKLHKQREVCPGFTFEYSVDGSDKLARLFWSDGHSKGNFRAFGDVVSFDATYCTNKYNMIFAPFTGKDNHEKCVTFAAALLTSEDVDSYAWVFQKFKECMRSIPRILITDQDPAMKIAVGRVLPDTIHRFCMWHIMCKVADKIPKSLKENEDFTRKFNDIVWTEHMEPTEFEVRWHAIMDEFGLTGDPWFKHMFEIRKHWIPAYFRDISMSGLFRTTSMSESENSFFRKYLNKGSNLVEFFMHYGTAIDAQRFAHDQLSSLDKLSFPECKSGWDLEKHAAAVYTHKIFYDMQRQIMFSINSCSIRNIITTSGGNIHEVDDHKYGTFHVVHDEQSKSTSCSCKRFVRRGLLCRHVLVVLKNMRINNIPDEYIVRRWTKYARVQQNQNSTFSSGVESGNGSVLKNIFSDFYSTIGHIHGSESILDEFAQDMRMLKEKYEGRTPTSTLYASKQSIFQKYYGATVPNTVDVHPPDPVKTKGSGSRIKSRKEKAFLKASKPKRRCGNCKQMVHHDSRNCDKVRESIPKDV